MLREIDADDEVDVLFYEDDPDVAQRYELNLQLDGYRVHAVRPGAEEVNPFGSAVPDVVFIDVESPQRPGMSALRRLRADGRMRNVPTVILSSIGVDELENHGFHLTELDYFIRVPTPRQPLQ